jgi:hypothetical protein
MEAELLACDDGGSGDSVGIAKHLVPSLAWTDTAHLTSGLPAVTILASVIVMLVSRAR